MWHCPKCNEQLEDQFDSCWRCAGNSDVNTPSRSGRPATSKRRIFLFFALATGSFLFFSAPQIYSFFTHTVYRSASPGQGGTAYFVQQSDAFTTVVDLYISDTKYSFFTMRKVATLLESPIDPYPQEAIWSGDGSVVAVRADSGRWRYAYDYRLHKSWQERKASPSISALLRVRGGEGKIIFRDPDHYKSLSRPLYPWELLAIKE